MVSRPRASLAVAQLVLVLLLTSACGAGEVKRSAQVADRNSSGKRDQPAASRSSPLILRLHLLDRLAFRVAAPRNYLPVRLGRPSRTVQGTRVITEWSRDCSPLDLPLLKRLETALRLTNCGS